METVTIQSVDGYILTYSKSDLKNNRFISGTLIEKHLSSHPTFILQFKREIVGCLITLIRECILQIHGMNAFDLKELSKMLNYISGDNHIITELAKILECKNMMDLFGRKIPIINEINISNPFYVCAYDEIEAAKRIKNIDDKINNMVKYDEFIVDKNIIKFIVKNINVRDDFITKIFFNLRSYPHQCANLHDDLRVSLEYYHYAVCRGESCETVVNYSVRPTKTYSDPDDYINDIIITIIDDAYKKLVAPPPTKKSRISQ